MYPSRKAVDSLRGFIAVAAVLLLAGCAATVDPGQALMNRGDYGLAADVFRTEEAERPYDPAVKRRLGVALLRSGDADRSALKLEEARALAPEEPSTYLFLGHAREGRGDLGGAIEAYAEYLRLGGKGEKAVRGKIDKLSSDLVLRQIGELLSREAEMMDRPGDNSVAVSDFSLTTGEADLTSLSKGLSAVVITDLRKVDRFRVLERERLGVLLRELDLGAIGTSSGTDSVRADGAGQDASAPDGATNLADQTRLIDERTAPRVGRLLSVRHFVQGFYGSSGADRIQLNANIVDIDGTFAKTGSPVDGPVRDVLYLEKGLVLQILRTLGVEPTPEERKKIDEVATRSFEAFVAYSRGLAYRDAGRTAEAAQAFREAVEADPGFTEAAENLDEVSWTESDFGGLEDGAVDELFGEPGAVDDGRFLIDVAVGVVGAPAPDAPDDVGSHDGPAEPETGRVGPSDSEVFGDAGRIEFPLPPAGGSR